MALALQTAEQGTKDLKSATGTTLPKDLHYTSPHLPNSQSTSGKEEIMCQFPAIGVWVSMYPVHANSTLLNAISVRKLDILPKLAGQIRTKQTRDLQNHRNALRRLTT